MSRTAKEIETTGLPCEAQNGETIQVVPKVDVTMFGKSRKVWRFRTL